MSCKYWLGFEEITKPELLMESGIAEEGLEGDLLFDDEDEDE